MRNRTRVIIIGSIGITATIISVITWIYPYSPLSFNKSYTYHPSPKVVQGYVEDINDVKREQSEKTEVDLKKHKVQQVLEMFEQEWLISIDSTKMNEQKLSIILHKVKNSREHLLNLVVQQNYKKEEKDYLISSIEALLVLEDSITDIKHNTKLSRSNLDTRFSNLHMDFINSFYVFGNFIRLTQNNQRAYYIKPQCNKGFTI